MDKKRKILENLIEELKIYCISKDNTIIMLMGATMKRISVLLMLNNNQYVDIFSDYKLEDIKGIYIKNQKTDKKIYSLVKDINSASFKNGKIRINRNWMYI